MTVTTKTLTTEKCSCDCGMVTLTIDAIFDDFDRPFYSLEHMAEDGINAYIERYADGE